MYWLEQRASDVPRSDAWLAECEAARLGTMRVPKRRADWRLGRWTAKQAVGAYLGFRCPGQLSRIEIRVRPSGAPEVWVGHRPASFSISISHCSGVGLCAISPEGTQAGCDLEAVEPRSAAFLRDYFTEEEQSRVCAAPESERVQLVTLLWSAKESVLKALGAGLRLDTRSVAVLSVNEPAPADEWRRFCISFAGECFRGWWSIEGGLIRTLAGRGGADSPPQILSTAPILSISA
jgi:4'-phosphopantetheinyl transferase